MLRAQAPIRTLLARRSASSSAPQQPQNQQVQQAVESAQKAYDAASATVKRWSGPIGDKLSGALGGAWTMSRAGTTVDAISAGYAQPIKYNAKVVASIARQVYQAEKLAPPTNLSTWANAYAQIWARGTSAQWYKSIAANGEWAKVGIYVSIR